MTGRGRHLLRPAWQNENTPIGQNVSMTHQPEPPSSEPDSFKRKRSSDQQKPSKRRSRFDTTRKQKFPKPSKNDPLIILKSPKQPKVKYKLPSFSKTKWRQITNQGKTYYSRNNESVWEKPKELRKVLDELNNYIEEGGIIGKKAQEELDVLVQDYDANKKPTSYKKVPGSGGYELVVITDEGPGSMQDAFSFVPGGGRTPMLAEGVKRKRAFDLSGFTELKSTLVRPSLPDLAKIMENQVESLGLSDSVYKKKVIENERIRQEGANLSSNEKEKAFFNLLKEKEIPSSAEFEDALSKGLVNDPRYEFLKDHDLRKKLYEQYIQDKKKEEETIKREERQKAKKDLISILEKLSQTQNGEEAVISANMRWAECLRVLKKNKKYDYVLIKVGSEVDLVIRNFLDALYRKNQQLKREKIEGEITDVKNKLLKVWESEIRFLCKFR
eukprot:snap_masked-scaffold_17-processed-gene-2.41-mRNA-1 protein AED:1.00 eAED:1.00 QI:0/0/0/0/1/1/4/0/441